MIQKGCGTFDSVGCNQKSRLFRRGVLARAVLNDATKGAAEILTSALSLSEVSRPSSKPDGVAASTDDLAAFFQNDFIVVVMLDRQIGELARALMQRGYAGLKPLDAVHLASALIANIDEMHTFDDKLVRLSERIVKRDGKPLKICKPSMGGDPLPLLETPPNTLEVPPDREETPDDRSESPEPEHQTQD